MSDNTAQPMKDESENIHDMISLCPQPDAAIGKLLDICYALNRRIDTLEANAKREELLNRRTANVASCLANGIQPD